MKGERKIKFALVSDFIWRSLGNLNMSRDLMTSNTLTSPRLASILRLPAPFVA